MTLAPVLTALDVCDLETIGRTSGQARVVEIWFAADPARDRIYFLSGGRDDAHWLRNLRLQAAVRVRLGERWYAGRAEEIEGSADEALARRLLATKYEAWREGRPLSAWARDSLPVALDLDRVASA